MSYDLVKDIFLYVFSATRTATAKCANVRCKDTCFARMDMNVSSKLLTFISASLCNLYE